MQRGIGGSSCAYASRVRRITASSVLASLRLSSPFRDGCSRDRTRTGVLLIMSQARYQLLHPAMGMNDRCKYSNGDRSRHCRSNQDVVRPIGLTGLPSRGVRHDAPYGANRETRARCGRRVFVEPSMVDLWQRQHVGVIEQAIQDKHHCEAIWRRPELQEAPKGLLRGHRIRATLRDA